MRRGLALLAALALLGCEPGPWTRDLAGVPPYAALPPGMTVDPRIAGVYDVPGDVAWQLRPGGQRPAIYPFGEARPTFAAGTTPEAVAAFAQELGATVLGRIGIPGGPFDPAGPATPAIMTDTWRLDPAPSAGDLADLPALLAADSGADFPRPPLIFSSEQALRRYHAWLRLRAGVAARGGLGPRLDEAAGGAPCPLPSADPYAQPGCTPPPSPQPFPTPRFHGVMARPRPSVALLPAAPCPGDEVALTGTGAPAGEPIGVWIGPEGSMSIVRNGLPHPREGHYYTELGTVSADAEGRFALRFAMKDFEAGRWSGAPMYSLWLAYERAGTIAPGVVSWSCGELRPWSPWD